MPPKRKKAVSPEMEAKKRLKSEQEEVEICAKQEEEKEHYETLPLGFEDCWTWLSRHASREAWRKFVPLLQFVLGRSSWEKLKPHGYRKGMRSLKNAVLQNERKFVSVVQDFFVNKALMLLSSKQFDKVLQQHRFFRQSKSATTLALPVVSLLHRAEQGRAFVGAHSAGALRVF